MELIYSMRRKPQKCEPPLLSGPDAIRPLCSISVHNVIAFSSATALEDSNGDSCAGYVYVADLDTPWDYHLVVMLEHSISCLEWDCEGKHIAVGTTAGDLSVYGQKEYLLNDWICLYTANYPSEPLVSCVLFHNGRRISTDSSGSKDATLDRTRTLTSTPTLRGQGGVSVEGCLSVSSCGALLAVARGAGPQCSAPLRAARERVLAAHFNHNKDGSVSLAAVCTRGGGAACVRVSRVTVWRPPHRIALRVTQLPTVLIHQINTTCVCWSRDSEWLYVGGDSLSVWRLAPTPHPTHQRLHRATSAGTGGQKTDCFTTLRWQRVSQWSVPAASAVAALNDGAVVAAGGALHVVNAKHAQPLSSLSVASSSPPTDGAGVAKRTKYSAWRGITHVCVSHSAAVCVCVDHRSQLSVCALPQPWTDNTSPLALGVALSALEQSCVWGRDCLDLLYTLAHSAAEALADRVWESFSRQPAAFQQYYYHSFLNMRIALLRSAGTPAALNSVAALSCAAASAAAWAAAVNTIRTDERADSALMALIDDKGVTGAMLDKALVSLECKPEPALEGAGLQPLSRHLVRALHTANTVIAAAAHQAHGAEVWLEVSLVSTVRKLVALSRSEGALPRLLARLAASAHHKPELLDECAALASVAPDRVWECVPRTGVGAPHRHCRPYQLQYGCCPPPPLLRVSPAPPPHAASDHHNNIDYINYMYLGVSPPRYRRCTRCGVKSLPLQGPPAQGPAPAPPQQAPALKLPAQRAVAYRFLPSCRCGGRWTLVTNV